MGVTTFGFTKVEVIERVDYDHTINLEWGNHARLIRCDSAL